MCAGDDGAVDVDVAVKESDLHFLSNTRQEVIPHAAGGEQAADEVEISFAVL